MPSIPTTKNIQPTTEDHQEPSKPNPAIPYNTSATPSSPKIKKYVQGKFLIPGKIPRSNIPLRIQHTDTGVISNGIPITVRM